MRIYTRTGDNGTTSLIYGKRVPKNDIRVEAYGTCDEANAVIGFAISQLNDEELSWSNAVARHFREEMQQVQQLLFHVGSELATPKGKEVVWQLQSRHVAILEKQIDTWQEKLPPIRQFILPGGHPAAAGFHQARTIIRRVERMVVALKEEISPIVLTYLNRLSDYLFVVARYINQISKENEVLFETME
ncbi:Cob(I)yrinic acid a,c-diamide adenosyltransferase [Paraliobacillus sp. PM-2]|uniref:cob(I)yrinic acid a,c-diamide adenosyltransferase n=1 Tax=Paraliobacillus sp. PM-2 TaxID=1462524 RepID=UPI00061BC09E|nr:cob(I)yrinic acid a,c-diamide adenosyltransferase [Paraliobacillus sp. PM-2]CQR47201.1 Cob(I)yrinic acid a,c-diamide adenosyltransferase [Paraliobacillus sp. PM-2]